MSKFADDKILLKLYRIYGKDEALKYLFDEISRLKFQVGELKSEVSELKYINSQPQKKITTVDERIVELQKAIITKGKNNKKLQSEVIEWRNKYFNLIAKTGNP